MLDGAIRYLGQPNIGTNQYDTGECVGLYNKVVLDVSGILYPIKGAVGAKDILTATNTRPDLFQQIPNNPNDPNQLPQVGDWIIWGSTWGAGFGHIACAKTVSKDSFTSIEQNYNYNKKVTEQWHNWSGVIGWVRYTPTSPPPPPQPTGANMTDDTARQIGFNYLGRNGYDGRPNALSAPQPDLQNQPLTNQKLGEIFLSQEARNWRDGELPKVYKERDDLRVAYQKEVNNNIVLAQQVNDLNAQIVELNKQLKDANKKIADLEAQLASCGGTTDITINFNFFGQILWAILKAFGVNKKG